MKPETPNPNERGASLVSYALILTLFTLVTVGGVRMLQASAAEVLNDTGDGYGAARELTSEVLVREIAPPPFVPPTTERPNLLTYSERLVGSPAGCLGVGDGGTLVAMGCSQPGVLEVSGYSQDGKRLRLSVDNENQCFTAAPEPDGVGGAVTLSPCGEANQQWTQLSMNGYTVVYQHEVTGLCLTVGDDLSVLVATCGGNPNEQMTVRF